LRATISILGDRPIRPKIALFDHVRLRFGQKSANACRGRGMKRPCRGTADAPAQKAPATGHRRAAASELRQRFERPVRS
jgi:hypothetical protein